MVDADPGAGSITEKSTRGIALFALLALATACGKDEAAPAKGDAGMQTPAMTKSADDMKKSTESAGMPGAEMRTVTLSIEGMT
jgi:hypothetical protein